MELLPALAAGQRSAFVFRVPEPRVLAARGSAREGARVRLSGAARALTADELAAIDALLKSVRSKLDARRLDERGMVRSPDVYFPIRVSPSLLTRAVELLRTLLARALSCGASLCLVDPSGSHRLTLNVGGHQFSLQVEESSVRVEIPPGRRLKRLGGYSSPSDAWRLQAAGKLTLRWSGAGYGRAAISDGRARIEDQLDEVIIRMFEQVAAEEEEARISDERRVRAIAYLHDLDKPRQEVEFQERRKRQLESEARRWRRAQALRDYLVAVEKMGIRAGRATHASAESWRRWIAWAHDYVDSLSESRASELSAGESQIRADVADLFAGSEGRRAPSGSRIALLVGKL